MASPSQARKGKGERIGGYGPRLSKSKHAGLVMPVLKFHKDLKKKRVAKNIRTLASVYMTGVIEYLVAEVLEVSGDVAATSKKRRITPRHICLATRHDDELNKLLQNVVFPEGGVVPNIHQVLLKRSILNLSNVTLNR